MTNDFDWYKDEHAEHDLELAVAFGEYRKRQARLRVAAWVGSTVSVLVAYVLGYCVGKGWLLW